MRKLSIALCLIIMSCMQLSAQSLFKFSNWNIAKVGLHFGADKDMVNGLDGNYFMSMIGDEANYDYSGLNLHPDNYFAAVCENPNIRLELVLSSEHFKNTEWRFNVNGIFNRVDAVSYYNDNNDFYGEYMNFYSHGIEVALESVMVKG